jgi:hypothetical protein
MVKMNQKMLALDRACRISFNGKRAKLVSLLLIALVLAAFLACSPRAKNAEESGKASIESIEPKEPVGTGFILELTHTGFGYFEGHGFDTHIYHFLSLPGGRIEEVVQYEKSDKGKREVARFAIKQAGNDVVIAERSERTSLEPKTRATLSLTANAPGQRIGGLFGGALETLEHGGLRFVSASNTYEGDYFILSEEGKRTSLIKEKGYRDIQGLYLMPQASEPGLYRERIDGDNEGVEDIIIRFWASDGAEYTFEAESVVPLYRVVISGFQESLKGNDSMVNIAILDTVLDHDRNVRPIYPVLAQGF